MQQDRTEAVARRLGMNTVPDSVDELRRSIRAELRDLHPDRNGGDFATPESRNRFSELSDALALLDAGPATALVPLDTVGPMVSAIVDALDRSGRTSPRPSADEAVLVAQRDRLRREARAESSARFRIPRYASAAVGALSAALWSLPQLVTAFGSDGATEALQASILSGLLAHPLFDPVSFGLTLYAAIFFGSTYVMEQNELARIDWLTTDAAQAPLLKRALAIARGRNEEDTLTKSDMRVVVGRTFRWSFWLALFGARRVTDSFLDAVVNQHVSEMVARRVLTPVETTSLSPRYRVAPEVVAELAAL